MSEYKLIYFDARGRAELVRWIFKHGGIPFTDERIKREDWPQRKTTIPGGKLPVLMVNDQILPQSLAMARFAAKKANLVPQNDLQAAFVDALADTLVEIMAEFFKIMFSDKTEEEKKNIVKDEFLPNKVIPIAERLDQRLTGREWYTSDHITWGDLIIGLFFNDLKMNQMDIVSKYPALLAHYNRVTSLPSIKNWLKIRPANQF